ncbi:MAG: hypothetical protein LBQ18_07655 [Campylobacteraceae bacterium]|jgi:hypothetical protein|nr:hypothetical protein [Campylobacteraceae bacterium]
MIDGDKYIETTSAYFDFLIKEFGFKIFAKTINGNFFYSVQYKNETQLISISYENLEDFLSIAIVSLKDGGANVYDETKALNLNQLSAKILPHINKNGITENNKYFYQYSPQNAAERQLLKTAKELRICLKYFGKDETFMKK